MGQALCIARVVLDHDPALLLQQKEGLWDKWTQLGRKAPQALIQGLTLNPSSWPGYLPSLL